jgi:hypothetical protein
MINSVDDIDQLASAFPQSTSTSGSTSRSSKMYRGVGTITFNHFIQSQSEIRRLIAYGNIILYSFSLFFSSIIFNIIIYLFFYLFVL